MTHQLEEETGVKKIEDENKVLKDENANLKEGKTRLRQDLGVLLREKWRKMRAPIEKGAAALAGPVGRAAP